MTDHKININKLGVMLLLFGTIVLENGSIPMRIIKVLIIGLAIIISVRRHYVTKSTYIKWLCLFSAYACMTTFWAIDRNTAKEMSMTLLLNLICLWAYVQFLNKKNQYVKLSYKLMTFLPIIALIAVIVEYGIGALTGLRELEGAQSALHNALGLRAAFAICLTIALKNTNSKKYNSFLEKVLIVLNLFIIALSGSRKAILYLLIPLLIYYVLKSKNPIKIIRNIILAICAVIVACILVMRIPYLYDMIGEGLQTMIAGLLGNETDASTSARLRLINWGIKVFKERPFFGYGLENFKMLHLFQFGALYVADNNYVELLVDQGLIGLLLYYAFHIWLVISFIKMISKNRNNVFLIMLFGMEIATIICDYGVLSYRNMYLQILFCTMTIVLQNLKK